MLLPNSSRLCLEPRPLLPGDWRKSDTQPISSPALFKISGRFLAAAASLGSACSLFAQQGPARLVLISRPEFTISIESPSYSSAVAGPGAGEQIVAGTGTYTITVGGSPVFNGSGFAFTGLITEASGQISTNAAGYALPKDVTWPNLLGSGIAAVIKQGSNIVVSNPASPTFTLKGNAQATLPFRFDSGNIQVSLSKFVLTAATTGATTLETDVSVANGPKLEVAGFGVSTAGATPPHISLAQPAPAGGHLMKLTFPQATVYAHFLDFATTEPFAITANTLSIDETGTPSCSSLSVSPLGTPATSALAEPLNSGALRASTDPELLGGAAPTGVIGLMQPLNFGIRPKAGTCSLKNGSLSLDALTFDLILPDILTQGGGVPAEIDGFTYKSGTLTLPAKQSGYVFHWTPANVGGIDLTLTSFAFDLKKGLQNISGSIAISGGLGPMKTTGTQCTVTGFSIDNRGPTGSVTIKPGSGGSLGKNLPISINSGTIDFLGGDVVGASFDVRTVKQDAGGVDIGLKVGFSKVGISASVALGTVPLPAIPGIGLQITGGSVQIDSNNNTAILMDGTMVIPTVTPLTQPLNLQFTGLGYAEGTIQAKGFKLLKPEHLDFGVLSIDLAGLTYQDTPTQIVVTGKVNLPDFLGVSGDVGFDGLSFTSSGGKLKLDIQGISADAVIPGLGHFGFSVKQAGNVGKFTNVWQGSATVQITGLPGFDANFFFADNEVWLITGGIPVIPPQPLVPPPSPTSAPLIFLTGIEGGLGHGIDVNVDAKGNQTYTPHAGNFVVKLGLDAGTLDHFTMWGTLTLTIGFPAVDVDLLGRMFVMASQPDDTKYADLDLNYKAPDKFTAKGQIHIDLPSTDFPLYQAYGTLDAEFSPARGYVYAGYPVDSNGFGSSELGIGYKAGLGIDLWPGVSGVRTLHAGAEQFIDWGFIKGSRGIQVDAGIPVAAGSPSVMLTIYAEGMVDFDVVTASIYAGVSGGWTGGKPSCSVDIHGSVHTPFGDLPVSLPSPVDLLQGLTKHKS